MYKRQGRHRPVRRKERHEQRTPYYAGVRRRYCVQSAGKHASDGKENRQDEEEIASYLSKILKKEAFDQKGLIYGMGHAVYLSLIHIS